MTTQEVPPPLQRVLSKLESLGCVVKHTGGLNHQAQCPAHDDVEPSLSIGMGDNGAVVLHCHAGCDTADVLSAMGMTWADLKQQNEVDTVYPYEDEDGELVYEVVRYRPKSFRQRRPDPADPRQRVWDMKGITLIPYRLPEVAELVAHGTNEEAIWITEGEKDTDAMRLAYDVVATCNSGGAGKWMDAHSQYFVGFKGHVYIVADRDKVGQKHALKVHDSLLEVAGIDAEIVQSAVGKDAADHCGDYGLDDFEHLDPGDLRALIGEDEGSSKPQPRWAEVSPDLQDGPVAEYVAAKLDGRYLRAPGLGWLHDTGKVWREVTDDTVVEATRLILRELVLNEIVFADKYRAPALLSLRRAGKIRSVTGLLRGILEVDASKFDTAADYLNTPDGVVDLRSGQLLPHSSEFYFTKISAARYVPGAQSADWDRALKALPKKVRDYLQLRLGQGITGHMTSDDKLSILQGGGANGKSTLVEAIRIALGGFAGMVPDRVLLANPGDHPTELTTLRGLRLAFMEELPEGARFSIKRLKDTVGTPTMTARKIAKDNITWSATHSLVITTNYTPKISETDEGTWRRLQLIRFPYTFHPPGRPLRGETDRRGDPRLRERLRRTPQEAVLAWLIDGARAWYAAGQQFPPAPTSVARDTLAWRRRTDLILGFIGDELRFDPEQVVLASDVYARFCAWLDQHGHPTWGSQTFTARFSEHSILREHRVTKARKRIDNLAVSYPVRNGPHLRSEINRPATGNLNVWLGLAWPEPEEPDG